MINRKPIESIDDLLEIQKHSLALLLAKSSRENSSSTDFEIMEVKRNMVASFIESILELKENMEKQDEKK